MKRIRMALIATAALSSATLVATAADLPERRFLKETASAGSCAPGVSQIASLPSFGEMMNAAEVRYEESNRNTESASVIDNRSPRYVWAMAARTACGIAIGHLSTGNVNAERLWNCECYHARMAGAGRSD